MLKLARAMIRLGRAEPEYRLLHETGRLSTSSIYVVGAYSGLEKLSEAHGPSFLVAQERVAVEALRRLFVFEVPNAVRKSDRLLDQLAQISAIKPLQALLLQGSAS